MITSMAMLVLGLDSMQAGSGNKHPDMYETAFSPSGNKNENTGVTLSFTSKDQDTAVHPRDGNLPIPGSGMSLAVDDGPGVPWTPGSPPTFANGGLNLASSNSVNDWLENLWQISFVTRSVDPGSSPMLTTISALVDDTSHPLNWDHDSDDLVAHNVYIVDVP
jgi:hypothetical protein